MKILVAEGLHELRITTSLKPPEFRRKFECIAGNSIYAYPLLKLVDSEPWGIWRKPLKYGGEITLESQPLETQNNYEGWKRLLFYNGKWVGNN